MADQLVRATSLGDQLAATLRMQIVQGEIPVGTHLVEDTIAERFNVSRGPVRDALRLLRLDHLIEPVGRRGLRVTGLEPKDIRDLYEVRRGIELMAVRAVSERSDPQLFAAMREAVAGMHDAAAVEAVDRFAQWDLRFHREMYIAADNRRLLGFWDQIEPLFGCMLAVTNQEDDELGPVVADHAALVDEISRGDSVAAANAVEAHLRGSKDRIMHAMRITECSSDSPVRVLRRGGID